jgi:citrate lyase beta subunit
MTRPIERLLESAIASAEADRVSIGQALAASRADLPLRHWAQLAHYTSPASDELMARKALVDGTAPMRRIIERFGVSVADLAERIESPAARVETLLESPAHAPLVVLDGEDSVALRDDVVKAGLLRAAAVLVAADTGPSTPLRYFRPAGFALGTTTQDLAVLLGELTRLAPGHSFLDGLIYPKVDDPEEIRLLYRFLDDAEAALGLAVGSIRVGILVESGWAVARLAEIAAVAAPRLSSIVFGLADYSADVGLPQIDAHHPLADWVRCLIVDIAGAVGVPAIDGMTLDYPVADTRLSVIQNRDRFLDRMALVHADAIHARDIGMHGKWVGHPAQLFAALLAFEATAERSELETHVSSLNFYRRSVDEAGRGAAVIGGRMSDRATDRHTRTVLRRAVATGRFDPRRAYELGVISDSELLDLLAAWPREEAPNG